MTKRYSQEEKEYMIEKAIEAVESLNGHYPSFKNYVWSVQHLMNGGEVKVPFDQLVYDTLKKNGKL